MSQAVQYPSDVLKIDIPTIQNPQECEVISKECSMKAFTHQISAVACFIATLALGYFAYIGAAALIKSFGILAAGVTVIAVATLFPITLGALAIPVMTLGIGVYSLMRASAYSTQRFAADIRAAQLLPVKA